jgi:hypothetical protein
MASPTTYPLALDGPLCPLLNDGDLLYQFYSGAFRREIKKFIRKHNWPGKPVLSYSVGSDTMKQALLSLLNAPEGRDRVTARMSQEGHELALYQAIWGWLGFQDADLLTAVEDHSHTVDEKVFMSPRELAGLLDARLKEGELSAEARKRLAILALGFAMLQPKDRKKLVKITADRLPEFKEAIGL